MALIGGLQLHDVQISDYSSALLALLSASLKNRRCDLRADAKEGFVGVHVASPPKRHKTLKRWPALCRVFGNIQRDQKARRSAFRGAIKPPVGKSTELLRPTIGDACRQARSQTHRFEAEVFMLDWRTSADNAGISR